MDEKAQRPTRSSNRFHLGLLAGLVTGAGLGALGISLLAGSGAGATLSPLPVLLADAGDGEYLFLPNRRHVWVVNTTVGRIIHYKFLDTGQGVIERSYVAEVDQKTFPPEDTVYALSERNIEDLLWVCNRRTGDVQLWRRNVRDGRLVSDPPIQAARDLLNDKAIRSSEPPSRP
jgi:hypothetical protein